VTAVLATDPVAAPAIHRSHWLIPPFTLHRPSSIGDTARLLAEYGDAAAPLAGGIDFTNRLKTGFGPQHVVALSGIAALRGVGLREGYVEIGAAATHREIASDPIVREHLPELAAYIAGLGNVRIRAQGTIGGNVMAGEPGYEILPILMALDAELHFVEGSEALPCRLDARALTALPVASRLLCHITIPLRPRTILWDRSLRPMITMVAAFTREGERLVAMGTALGASPIRPAWLPNPSAPISSEAARRDAAILARAWIAAWPIAGAASGETPSWHRRVAAVLLARAIARAAASP
jgi:aerobic carbon-monoxide dehydrogenase medium subunit